MPRVWCESCCRWVYTKLRKPNKKIASKKNMKRKINSNYLVFISNVKVKLLQFFFYMESNEKGKRIGKWFELKVRSFFSVDFWLITVEWHEYSHQTLILAAQFASRSPCFTALVTHNDGPLYQNSPYACFLYVS